MWKVSGNCKLIFAFEDEEPVDKISAQYAHYGRKKNKTARSQGGEWFQLTSKEKIGDKILTSRFVIYLRILGGLVQLRNSLSIQVLEHRSNR